MTGDDTIYLDYAATTPLDPAVLDAMLPYLHGVFGNPSSIYRLGQDAKAAIERARGAIARVIVPAARSTRTTCCLAEWTPPARMRVLIGVM